jgi:hypothetical protein
MEGRNFQVMKSDERDSSWCSRGKGGGRGKLKKRLRRLPPTFNCGALLNSPPGNLWLVIIDPREQLSRGIIAGKVAFMKTSSQVLPRLSNLSPATHSASLT